jgi:hypothetical protein
MKLLELTRKTLTYNEFLLEKPVISSWIADLEYDDDLEAVIMTTLGGGEYTITDVPYEEFEYWVEAESKGKHWWSDIKGIFTDT